MKNRKTKRKIREIPNFSWNNAIDKLFEMSNENKRKTENNLESTVR